jgi:hypothetical protein
MVYAKNIIKIEFCKKVGQKSKVKDRREYEKHEKNMGATCLGGDSRGRLRESKRQWHQHNQ